MNSLLIILLGTMLIQSSAIAMGKANQEVTARGVFTAEFTTAIFTTLTLTISSLTGYAFKQVPSELEAGYFRTPILIVALALIFFVCRLLLRRIPGAVRWPNFIAHLSNQCAMLGMALYSSDYLESASEALCYGAGAAIMLTTLNTSFNTLRQRVNMANVPVVFRGIPIALITAGFMALGLLGFAGMVRN